MNALLTGGSKQATETGLEEFADDIRDFLAFSEMPQTYQNIRDHFEESEEYFEEGTGYFEEDLDYIKDALDYLEDQDEVKKDVRLDGEHPSQAYSISDYEAI